MKHADTLNPTETLYESRFYEAFHRVQGAGYLKGAKLFRQVRIHCKGCFFSEAKSARNPHSKGKLWIVDFYIWPHLVVEIDGHDVRPDRDTCFEDRGLIPHHIRNQDVYEMDSAIEQVHILLLKYNAIRELRDTFGHGNKEQRASVARMHGLFTITGEGRGPGWAFPFMRQL